MPSVELVAKGRNSYVELTHADGRVDWISFKNALAAEEAVTAMGLGLEDAQTITLDTFFNRVMSHHLIPNLSQDTVSRYRAVYEGEIRGVLGADVLSAIGTSDVEMLRTKLKAQGDSGRHIKSVTDVLSAIMGVGAKWQYIKSNPLDKLDS